MWAAIGLVLLLPLVAMQFTREVAWTGFDFAVAAVLLIAGGVACELVAARVRVRRSRVMLGALILGVVLIVWAQGAVGIF